MDLKNKILIDLRLHAKAAAALSHALALGEAVGYLSGCPNIELPAGKDDKLSDISKELYRFVDEMEGRHIESAISVQKLASEGLKTDGAHHKQWYIERIFEAIGGDLADLWEGVDWDEGSAP